MRTRLVQDASNRLAVIISALVHPYGSAVGDHVSHTRTSAEHKPAIRAGSHRVSSGGPAFSMAAAAQALAEVELQRQLHSSLLPRVQTLLKRCECLEFHLLPSACCPIFYIRKSS